MSLDLSMKEQRKKLLVGMKNNKNEGIQRSKTLLDARKIKSDYFESKP